MRWASIFTKDILSKTAWLVKSAIMMTVMNSINDWVYSKSSNEQSFCAQSEEIKRSIKNNLSVNRCTSNK